MKTIKLRFLGVLVLMMSLMLTSCDDDSTTIIDPTNGQPNNFFVITDDDDETLEIDELCFEFVYPLNLTNTDGSTLTINDDAELETAVQAAISSGDFPTFNYPIQVIDEDDVTLSVADDEELCELAIECFEEDDCDCDEDEECFEVNFPITIILPDGTNVPVNDWDELETAVDNYYDANPNDEDDIDFVYPFTVTMLEDGSVETINDEDDLEALFEECYGDFYDDCFEFQFPLSFTMSDGSILTGNDEDELETAFEAWYIANPNDTTEPILNFPVTVIYDDGSTETVNDEDELDELFEECFGDDWDGCGKISAGDAISASDESLGKRVILKTTHAKNVAEAKAKQE